jgi:2,5-diketo-D-gluconate reductase A
MNWGCRHVDTARAYGNEADVGEAIIASGLPRDQIFVTTKLWLTDYGEARSATLDSLHRLGMEYVDLILLHAPGQRPNERRRAWEALEELMSEVGDSAYSHGFLHSYWSLRP